MKRAATILAFLILAGCGTAPEPKIETQTVNVDVPVHCKPDMGPGPSWKDDKGVVHQGYPDTRENLHAAPDLFARVQLMLAGRAMRIQRELELAAALKGCE